MRICFAVFGVILIVGCHRHKPVTVVPSPTTPVLPLPSPTPEPPVQTGWIKIQTERWKQARIRPEKIHFAQGIADQISRNQQRYESVARDTKVPWQVIGVIHNMEGSLNFRTNLGQGDPLTSQSRHVPKGRPPIPPEPPFPWEYAAEDSLRYDHLDRESWNPIGQILQNIEQWNGTGYQRFHPDIPSQYLWSWSTIEKPGKYVADGKWSSTAISSQCGAAMLLKSLP